MAQLIKANSTVQKVQPKNGNKFSLQELQGFVGGYIEIVYLPEGKCLVVNEEGCLQGLHVNPQATVLNNNSIIVGDVLYCNLEDLD